MEFNEVVKKRRTVRDFQNRAIPDSVIKYAVENSFMAPTYNHLREWDFILIQNIHSKIKLIEAENLGASINISELEETFRNEDIVMKEMYLDAIPKQKKMILEAPLVVVVVFRPKTEIARASRIYDLNCLASVWACIENFLLSLAEHDVYGVTYISQNTDSVKQSLNIPGYLEVASIIPIGYRSDNFKLLKQKPIEIENRIHLEKW